MAVGLFSLLFVPLGILLVVLIGAILFRAGVSMANKVLGPQKLETSDQQLSIGETIGNVPVVKDSTPYSAPASSLATPSQITTTAIPEPSMGKACGIVLVQALVSGLVNFVLALLLQNIGPTGEGVVLLASFLVAVAIYSAMLPTTFGKASLVYVFQILIAVAIAIGIAAIVYLFWLAMGT